MSYPIHYVPAGDVLPIFFATYDGGTGASLTMTGLAVTDIEIYKDGSVTQRSSDAGYTLLDTDGIDFDGITGIHGFSIDTGDNTDSGFYTVGAWFHVVVSAVTVDAQTVNFIAAAFRLMPAESVAGKPKVDVDAWLGTAAATPTVAGVPEVDVTHFGGSAGTFASGVPAVNATQLSGDSAAADNAEAFFDGTGYAGTNNVIPTVTTLTNDPTGVGTLLSRLGTPSDFGSGTSTIAANLQDMADNGTAAFDRSTDSLQAIRDHIGDGTNLTEAGGTGDHLTAINLPNQTMDITGNITGNLSGSVGSVTGAVGSVTGNVGGNVAGSVGSLAAQAKADVNAEVVDALNTDTYAEPAQGTPGATISLAAKIGYLFKAWRNRSTQTADTYSLYNDDATTVDHKATVSDDGTTLSRGEVATGP